MWNILYPVRIRRYKEEIPTDKFKDCKNYTGIIVSENCCICDIKLGL